MKLVFVSSLFGRHLTLDTVLIVGCAVYLLIMVPCVAPHDPLGDERIITSQFPGVGRIRASAVWSPEEGALKLYGGRLYIGSAITTTAELWTLDTGTWSWRLESSDDNLVGARFGHAGAWDPSRKAPLLFGGISASGACQGDFWSYNHLYRSWLQVRDDADHTVRLADAAIAVDRTSGSTWIMGGSCGTGPATLSFYELPYDAQSLVRHSLGVDDPWERIAAVAQYDPLTHRILLWGGHAPLVGVGPGQDAHWRKVWAFDPQTRSWEALTDGTQGPPQLSNSVGGFDPVSGLLLVAGGRIPSSQAISDEIWGFRPEDRTWHLLARDPRLRRTEAGGAYCVCSGELVVVGGRDTIATVPSGFREDVVRFRVETPATFSWKTIRPQNRMQSRAWGVLELEEDVAGIDPTSVRLINCKSSEVYDCETDVKAIGGGRWKVTFSDLSLAVRDASTSGELKLTGTTASTATSFLASVGPVPRRLDVPAVQVMSDVHSYPGTLMKIARTAEGWRIDVSAQLSGREVQIFDMRGRRICVVSRPQDAVDNGWTRYFWDGRSQTGERVSAGAYVARLESDKGRVSAKLIVY